MTGWPPGCGKCSTASASSCPLASWTLCLRERQPYQAPQTGFADRERNIFVDQFKATSLTERMKSETSQNQKKLRTHRPGSARGVELIYVTALAGQYFKSGGASNENRERRTEVVLYSIDSGPDEPEGPDASAQAIAPEVCATKVLPVASNALPLEQIPGY